MGKTAKALDIIVFVVIPFIVAISTLILISSVLLRDLISRPRLQLVNERISKLATWKKAPGQMDEARIWSDVRGLQPASFATVKYHYTVDGKEYSGNCLSSYQCAYVARGWNKKKDALSRLKPYLSEKDQISEGIGTGPFERSPQRKYLAHGSKVIIEVFYNPEKPDKSLLDNRDFERMSYSGKSSQLTPITWGNFYGVPIASFLFSTGLSIGIFAFCLRRFVFRGPGRVKNVGDHIVFQPETQTYVYHLQGQAQAVMLVLVGFFCLACAYGTWFVNLHKPHVVTTGGETISWILTLMFAIPGYAFVSLRSLVYLKLSERTVTHVTQIWLILFSLPIKHTWPFSDFASVGVKVVGVAARQMTTYVGMLYLVRKDGGKPLFFISSTVDGPEMPPDLKLQGEELAKRLNLTFQLEK